MDVPRRFPWALGPALAWVLLAAASSFAATGGRASPGPACAPLESPAPGATDLARPGSAGSAGPDAIDPASTDTAEPPEAASDDGAAAGITKPPHSGAGLEPSLDTGGPEAALLGRIHAMASEETAASLTREIAAAHLSARLRQALVNVLAEHLLKIVGDVAAVRRAMGQAPLPDLTRFMLGLPLLEATPPRPPPEFEGMTPEWKRAQASARARRWSHRPLLLFLVLDGLRAQLVDYLLERHELPVLRSTLIDRGLTVQRMVSCFPTVTSPNAATMLTGVWPDRHQIPALAWFDKERRSARLYTSVAGRALNRDMPREVRSLWEWLRHDYQVSTLGVPLERGAANRWFQLFYPASWLTRLARGYLRPGERPFAVCVWYAHTDTTAHLSGALSESELHAVRDFDTQLGKLVATLKGRGLYDRTVIVLASDHGMAPTIVNRDLSGHLRRQGIPLRGLNLSVDPFLPSAMNRRLRHAQAVAINVGAGSTSLYLDALKEGDDPQRILHAYPTPRGTVDLLARIFDVDAVDLVLYRRADQAVVVEGRRGRGLVRARRVGDGVLARYDVLSGVDPLHVPSSLRGLEIPARRFILETAATAYPGAVPSIGAAMESARLGDIVVTSRLGYNFSRHFHSRGGYHGGLSASEAITHLYLAGPGVPHATLPAATMADVTPTLLTLLGIPYDPGSLDGRTLIPPPAARSATSP